MNGTIESKELEEKLIEGLPDKKLSYWAKRKNKRSAWTMQDKATRSSWRAFLIYLLPAIAFGLTYYKYKNQEAIETLLIWGGVSVALLLLLSPLSLWWSVSAIRRGTRRLVLSIGTGFLSGTLTVALAVAILGFLAGYSLLTNQTIPIVNWDITLPGGIK